MAPRTLTSTWKQVERLAKRVRTSKAAKKKENTDVLDELLEKANNSRIVDALATMFVRSYSGMEDVSVRFATSNGHGFPDWVTSFSEEEKMIEINPIGILEFQDECDSSVEAMLTPAARASFQTYRYQAYLAELRKLPAMHLLFLHLLKEVAKAREVTHVEKKGGGLEEVEDEHYMRMLWAFKELETVFTENKGIDLRSEYEILWYESDWITGTK